MKIINRLLQILVYLGYLMMPYYFLSGLSTYLVETFDTSADIHSNVYKLRLVVHFILKIYYFFFWLVFVINWNLLFESLGITFLLCFLMIIGFYLILWFYYLIKKLYYLIKNK